MSLSALPRIVLLTLFLQACVSSYAPPGPVVPLFEKGGQLSAGANVRPFFPTAGANAYVAAAPTDATRLYVSGSLSHFDRAKDDDEAGREMRERNHTLQAELGLGWGRTFAEHAVVEVLGGAGYGVTDAHQHVRDWICEEGYCGLWVDSKSTFVRGFAQGQVGGHWSHGSSAGGLRISAIRYDFDWLMGAPSNRKAWVQTFEPFVGGTFGLPWGKIELQLLIPMVISRADASITTTDTYGRTGTYRGKLVETASPRFTLGLRADLRDLWGTSRSKVE